MQVKKFEASTMKEALEMIKSQLGPEAIILSVKGITRNGLLGKNSVEVTAAVSESTLHKKRLAELKLREQDKIKFQKAPAREQKAFIDNVVAEYEREHFEKSRAPITQVPYVDIDDDEPKIPHTSIGKNVRTLLSSMKSDSVEGSTDSLIEKTAQRLKRARAESLRQGEIQELKQEISQLKGIIEKYKSSGTPGVSLHPGANWGVPFELSFMFERLTDIGISEINAFDLLQIAQKQMTLPQMKDRAVIEAWVYRYLLDQILVSPDPYRGRVHVFVGPGGQGKTSTLMKFATHLVVAKKHSVAILNADNIKIGAGEQLKILSKILNSAFGSVRSQADWEDYLRALKDVDYILVDFPGLSLRSGTEIQLLQQFLPPKSVVHTIHYVQSAVCRDSEAFEMGQRYQALNFDDVVFTCVDEAVHHGIFYNFQKKFGVPIHSIGIGPKIPEDFEIAIKERILDLMFNITKQS